MAKAQPTPPEPDVEDATPPAVEELLGTDDDDKPDAYQALLDASTRAGPGGVAKRDLHKICKPYRRLGTEERGKLLDSMIADRVLYTVPTLSGRGLNYVASRFIQESAQ